MNNLIKKTALLLMLFFIGSIFGLNEQLGGIAAAYDCSTIASVEVTMGKALYTEGETVSGNFVLTNYTNASALVNFVGDLYENDVLIYTNSVDIMVYPGANSFNLSDIFESLSNYTNAQGNYRFEVSSSVAKAAGCIWSGLASLRNLHRRSHRRSRQ
jgi:hypothetical protein